MVIFNKNEMNMKTVILLFLTLLANESFGQSEKAQNKVVGDAFEKLYNSDDFEGIFAMFGANMSEALPLGKTTQFLAGLKMQAGKIVEREFVGYENTSAAYKTKFEKAVFGLYISIDKESKINGLLVKPYVEKRSADKVVNDLSIENAQLSKKQLEMIFEGAKVFPAETQLAFAIIKEGVVSYYGVKRLADKLTTIDNHNSIFEIGSISKVFTSTLLAGMVVDKKVNLEGDINDHIDVRDNAIISLRELSNHTSGLPRLPMNLDLNNVDPNNPYKEYDGADLKDYMSNMLELEEDKRGKFEYSNIGAGLLGYILAKHEGTSFDNLLRRNIFSKYDMNSSTVDHKKVTAEFVNGRNSDGEIVPNWEFASLAGAGGILSNVVDLSKFAIAQFDSSNQELALTQQETFAADDGTKVGLGWFIISSKSGKQLLWHNGATGGYSSSMAIDIKNKNAIVILTNVSAFNPDSAGIDQLCFGLMETLD